MTDQKPIGVFVRLPLSMDREAAFCDKVGDDDINEAILAIGTPVQPCADVETVDLSDHMPEYYDQGMGCGLEDRGITDRYEAMGYGWDQALERVCSELPEMVLRTDMVAQVVCAYEKGWAAGKRDACNQQSRVVAEKDAEIARLRDNLAHTLEIAMSRADGATCTHLVRQAFSLAKSTVMSADDVVQTVLGDLFPTLKGGAA